MNPSSAMPNVKSENRLTIAVVETTEELGQRSRRNIFKKGN